MSDDFAGIRDASWEYFRSFFDEETVFVASEFGIDLREKLTELGLTYVNFWFHPYKLLNDAFFLVGTNSSAIFQKLETYRVPSSRLRFYCEYYAQLAARKHFLDNLPIEDNCCVFAGQTYRDKSVSNGEKYLNITDYPERVAELARTYSKVYYVQHPSAEPNPEVDAFLEAAPGVEVLKDVPTYFLLASPKVRKVVALSSSVLYEAAFFGKETEYLFRPLFKIDEAFSLDTFVSIYQDYFSPAFWRDILAPGDGAAEGGTAAGRDECLLARDCEMFRDLLGVSFGYRHFGRIDRLEARLDKMGAAQREQLAAEERRCEAFASLSDLVGRQGELLGRHDEMLNRQRGQVNSLLAKQGEGGGSAAPAARMEALSRETAALWETVRRLEAENSRLNRLLAAVSRSWPVRLFLREEMKRAGGKGR